MNIKKSDILKSISLVSLATGNNGSYMNLNFDGGRVWATNGQMMAEATLPLGISCAVPSKDLVKVLKSIPDEEIDVKEVRGNLYITSAHVDANINGVREIPKFNFEKREPTAISNVEHLIKGLDFCSNAVSRDISDGILCGVYVNGAYFYATDKFRLARWSLNIPCVQDTPNIKYGYSIPIGCISILREAGKCIGIDLKEREYIEFIFEGGFRVRSSVFVGVFPDLSKYFTDEGTFIEVNLNQSFHSVLSKHTYWQKNTEFSSREIRVTIAEGCCTFNSESAKNGSFSEKVDCTTIFHSDNKCVSFYLSPILFNGVDEGSQFIYYPSSGKIEVKGPDYSFLVLARS